MALTASQIVNLVCQITKQTGKQTLVGQQLNLVLQNYCHIRDLYFIQKTATINLSPPVVVNPYNIKIGYPLPNDYLRARQVFYDLQGEIIDCDEIALERYNQMYAGEGVLSYPSSYATDPSQNPKLIYMWPPVGFPIQLTVLYYPLMPDIQSPESSSVIPWYPDQRSLITDLCAEACKLSDDTTRKNDFMREAEDWMRKFLTNGDNDESRYAQRVQLDPVSWRGRQALKPTKNLPY